MHGPSTRGKLLIAALALTLVGGFVCMFFPLFFAQTFYYSRETILVLIPAKNFVLLAIAVVCIVAMLVLLAFIRNKWTYSASAIFVATALFSGYASAMSITLIEQGGITMHNVFDERHYAWDDMTHVTYYYTAHIDEGKYVFMLQNGDELEIVETPLFDDHKKGLLRELFKEHDIVYHSHSN